VVYHYSGVSGGGVHRAGHPGGERRRGGLPDHGGNFRPGQHFHPAGAGLPVVRIHHPDHGVVHAGGKRAVIVAGLVHRGQLVQCRFLRGRFLAGFLGGADRQHRIVRAFNDPETQCRVRLGLFSGIG
jgi:hypothetical protein